MKRCDCPQHLGVLANARLELAGQHHTWAYVGPCERCGGVFGFPPHNLDLALREGTPETLAFLTALGRNE